MKSSLLYLSFIFITVLLVCPDSVIGAKTNGKVPSNYRDLKREEKQLIADIKGSKKKQGEVQYVSGHLHNFRNCMLSKDLRSVRRNGNGIASRLKDRSLKQLVKDFVLSIDGTKDVTSLERDAYINLCNSLESDLAFPVTGMVRLKKLRIALLPFIPPDLGRKMTRHARTLARGATGEKRIVKRIAALEGQYAKEKSNCEKMPLRDKKKLRDLSGQLALNRKKLKLIDAASTLAKCLTDSISDGKLLTEEKKNLTKAQQNYARLEASVGNLKNG